MNPPLKKLTAIVTVMFLSLMAALTYIHFFQAPQLNADDRNARRIIREYDTDRGAIVVAGTPIVDSQPSDDNYKYQRVYANGELYAHLTGYFSVAQNSMTGIEDSQNSVLSGSDSSLFAQQIQQLVTDQQPQGGSVALTIDPDVQLAAAQALGNRRGAVVAIEPTTGKILALYSSPSFDPNTLASHDPKAADDAWNALRNNESQPLINRATGGDLYPPGSTFKIITAAAMIESGRTPDSVVDTPRAYTLPGTSTQVPNSHPACSTPDEKLTLKQAIVLSCNTTFAKAAVELGAETMIAKAEAFGFNQELDDIGIPVTPSRFPKPGNEAELAQDAFGQQDIQASPLQMAMVVAAVANHGVLMRPYLVEQTLTSDLDVLTTTETEKMSEPISRSTADALTEMMKGVAENHPDAQVPGITTAGKTGTAENGRPEDKKDPHAWYMAFEVSEKSRVAVAVFIQNPSEDNNNARSVAAAVIKAATS